jgi:mercuric ion transport protein
VRTVRGYLLLGAAFVLCPCHLPLLASLLAGTAVGGVLAANTLALAAVGTIAFAGALLLGLRTLNGARSSPCPSCDDDARAGGSVRPEAAPAGARRRGP